VPVIKDDQQGHLKRAYRSLGMQAKPKKDTTPHKVASRERLSTPNLKATGLKPKQLDSARVAAMPPQQRAFVRSTRAMAAGKTPETTKVKIQQAGLIPGLTPNPSFDKHGRAIRSGGFGYKVAREAFNQILGAPFVPIVIGAAAGHDVTHPADVAKGRSHTYRDVVKPIGVSFKESVTDPGKNPLATAENAFAIASLGAGALTRASGAVAGASIAREAGEGALKGAARGARTAKRAPIEVHVPGKDGKTVTVRVTRSKNELVNVVKRHRAARENKRFGKNPGTPDQGFGQSFLATYGTPEARVGRLLAKQNQVEHQLLDAAGHGLGRFHRRVAGVKVGRSVLSDAEEKALDVASTHGRQIVGDEQAVREAVMTHRLYHAQAGKQARAEQAHIAALEKDRDAAVQAGDVGEAKRLERALKRASREYGDPAGHDAQIELAKLAEQHLVKPSKKLQMALERVPHVGAKREDLLEPMQTRPRKPGETPKSRLDETRQLYRLGARHLELTHGARGVETPLQELERHKTDQAALENLKASKTGTKIVLLQKMLERVEKAREKRGGHDHAEELTQIKGMLDAFTKQYGPLVKVLGAKGANDLLQEQGAAGRVIHAPAPREHRARAGDGAAHGGVGDGGARGHEGQVPGRPRPLHSRRALQAGEAAPRAVRAVGGRASRAAVPEHVERPPPQGRERRAACRAAIRR
jgi:hypothetical protein